MTALLLKFAPWLIAAAALLGVGGWGGYHLNPYPARYKALLASDAIERAHGEEAVRQALSAQLAQAQEVTRNNQAAMVLLAKQNSETAADRDASVSRVHRLEQLLHAETAARAAQSAHLPQASDRPPVAAASDPSSPSPIERLLVAASAECDQTANQLNALIQEIKLQL